MKSGGGLGINGAQPTWFQYLNPTSTLPETFWGNEKGLHVSGRFAVSGYERAELTLQFQKSMDSKTTTITVWGPKGVNVSCSIPSLGPTPFLGMRLRFGTH